MSNTGIRTLEEDKNYRAGQLAGFKDGMNKACELLFYMTAYTLNYKLGYGKVRLFRIMKDIYNNVDAFRTNHLTDEDFRIIKQEMIDMGIRMKEKGD